MIEKQFLLVCYQFSSIILFSLSLFLSFPTFINARRSPWKRMILMSSMAFMLIWTTRIMDQ